MARKPKAEGDADPFLHDLEAGVRAVLNNKDATPSERVQAINAGAKIAMIKFKISGSDEKSFFDV